MGYPIASKHTVQDYLIEVYELKPGVVAELLAEDNKKWRELARGIEYRSHACNVGDRIAEHGGVVAAYSDAKFEAYAYRYENDDEEGDD